MNLNQVVLSGRLTADAELKHTDADLAICNFRMAVNNRRNNTTLFVDVTCFGKQADAIAQYLTKGTLVGVVGRLDIREVGEGENMKRYTSVVAENVELGPKNS